MFEIWIKNYYRTKSEDIFNFFMDTLTVNFGYVLKAFKKSDQKLHGLFGLYSRWTSAKSQCRMIMGSFSHFQLKY